MIDLPTLNESLSAIRSFKATREKDARKRGERPLLAARTLRTRRFGLSMAMRFNDAYVLIMVLPPWRAEVSLNLALAVLFRRLCPALWGPARHCADAVAARASPGLPRNPAQGEGGVRLQDARAPVVRRPLRPCPEKGGGGAFRRRGAGLAALIAARAAQRMRESGQAGGLARPRDAG